LRWKVFHWPKLPRHLIHSNLTDTVVVLGWSLLGVVMTAPGGLTAARAKDSRTRLVIGMVLTLAGVAVVGSAVLYHNSLSQALAPDWS
jgi:hypothetical protein